MLQQRKVRLLWSIMLFSGRELGGHLSFGRLDHLGHGVAGTLQIIECPELAQPNDRAHSGTLKSRLSSAPSQS